MPDPTPDTIRLYDRAGWRLYLTPSERRRFVMAAKQEPTATRALCLCLVHTGCRVSEALALTPASLQAEDGVLMIESLKKRRAGHFREIPIPADLIALLTQLSERQRRFWPIGRATAWRQIKAVMVEAGIAGPQATSKGLRHAFAMQAVMNDVSPLSCRNGWAIRISGPRRSTHRFAVPRSGRSRRGCGGSDHGPRDCAPSEYGSKQGRIRLLFALYLLCDPSETASRNSFSTASTPAFAAFR